MALISSRYGDDLVTIEWSIDDVSRSVVSIRGEIDIHTLGTVQDAFADLAKRTEGDVVLDLGEVEFVDGRGISALSVLSARLADTDRRTVLRNVPRMTKRLLEITGIDENVTIESSDGEHAA